MKRSVLSIVLLLISLSATTAGATQQETANSIEKSVTVTLTEKMVEGTKILEVNTEAASGLFDLMGASQPIGGAGELVNRTGSISCSVSPNPGVGLDYQCYILPGGQ